jgi:predicted TIM-barrel fold metal-dependent hydrolase
MKKTRFIDADAHFIEPEEMWLEYLEPDFRQMAPRAVVNTEGHSCILIGDYLKKMLVTREYRDTPESRLNAMDEEGIDAMVIYPTLGLTFAGLQRVDLYAALCRAYNHWARDYCGTDSARLIAPAMVPQSDVYETLKEARRGVVELNLKGVFMRPNPIGGRTFDHPAWEPLWCLLEELDTPLVLHEGTSGNVPQVGQDRFDNPLFTHAISHPCEHMMAMLSLICGGVLERHPKMRVVHVEAGCGWVPYWLERMDHHIFRSAAMNAAYKIGASGGKLKLRPSDYFKRQCLVSADPEENILAEVVSSVGDENIAFSTDFPHNDHEFSGMFAKCAARTELTEQNKARILGGNVARVFRI